MSKLRQAICGNPNNKIIDKHTLDYIDKMLLEKISLARIARVTSVSKKWLQNYVNTKYASVPQQVKVSSKHKSKLNIECDEAWSFVNHKGNKQWIWLALDKKTREIVGCYIGELRGGLEDYGILSHQFIGNVLFVIQIIGRPLSKLFQANGIKPWVKTVG
jgi:hypothetical protein